MKKIIAIVLVVFLTYSCSDESTQVFEKNATERAAENIKEFDTHLNSTNWIIELFPNSKQSFGGFGIYADFNSEGKVSLANEFTYASISSTTYGILPREGSVLSFNEYNSGIHIFAKPSFKNPKGLLKTTDYEFIYLKREGDVIYTKGVKTGNDIRFISTKDAPEEYFKKVQAVKSIMADNTKILFLQKPTGVTYSVSFSGSGIDGGPNRVLVFEEIGGEAVKVAFIYRPDGIRLYKPITIDGTTFDHLYLKLNNGENQFETENGDIVLKLDKPLVDFSTKSFVIKFQENFVSPAFLKFFNDFNATITDKLSDRLTFMNFSGTPIVIGTANSGLYAYERSYKTPATDKVLFSFPKVYGKYSNANGATLLKEISSKSVYKIEDFNDDYYKLISVSNKDFWFLINK